MPFGSLRVRDGRTAGCPFGLGRDTVAIGWSSDTGLFHADRSVCRTRGPHFVYRSVNSEDRCSITSNMLILTYSLSMSIADLPHPRCVDRTPAHRRPRAPGGGPHCALNLDNLRLPDFCAPGYSPSQRRANVYKVQVNLVEKSMPLVLRKSLQGPVEPCREVLCFPHSALMTGNHLHLEFLVSR